MTHFNTPFSYPLNVVCFHTCTNTSTPIVSSAVIKPQSVESIAGSHSSSMNTTTGIITLPNTQCMLIGSITYRSSDTGSYVRYRWYDTTNSQYIGSIGQSRGLDENRHAANITNEISCDEEAIAIAQNINVKLVVTAVSSNNCVLDGDLFNYGIYAGKTKLTIYEF